MHHPMKMFTLVASFCMACTAAYAEPAPVLSPARDVDGKALPFGRPVYQTPDTPLGSGPYKAIMAMESTLPEHTLYYPADMAAAGRLPVITWGNGACINAGNRFRIFLTEIASHGFLVISGGAIANTKYEVGPQENPVVGPAGATPAPPSSPATTPPPAPGDAAGRNTVPQLIAAIDWAVQENERAGSKFYHRLDITRIGVGGQSCGGALAAQVSADPRITAVAIFSGAPRMTPTPNAPPAPAGAIPPPSAKAQLDAFHAPVLFLAGDAEHDIAYPSSAEDAAYVSKVPVFFAWQDQLTHIGTYGMPNGGQLGRLAWQWYAWQLRDDPIAAKTFRGQDCALCVEQGWHVTKKSID
jgi:hypothetical protein